MALQILEKNGTFELHGSLNTQTSQSFLIHFEHLIKTGKNVIVNIDKINTMDFSGVEALKSLIAIAFRDNKILSVIGKNYKEIYNEYGFSKVA
jgi:anti-anti-sigma regulatory factor